MTPDTKGLAERPSVGSWRCAPCLSIPTHPRTRPSLLGAVHPLLPPTAARRQAKRDSKARAPLYPSPSPAPASPQSCPPAPQSSRVQPQACPRPAWEGSNRVPALPSSVTSATATLYNTARSPSTSGTDVHPGLRCDCFRQSLTFTRRERGRGRIQTQRFARW